MVITFYPLSHSQIICPGMGSTDFFEGLVQKIVVPPTMPLYQGRAGHRHQPTWSRLPAEMQGGEVEGLPQMCRGSSRACCKPSENRTQLNPRHARALRPPARPTTLRSARRQPRRAAARAARALRAARRRRGEPALPRLSRPLLCAWCPHVAAQVRSEWEGKSCTRRAPSGLCGDWAPQESMRQ